MAVRPRNGSFQADVKLGPTRYRETFKTKAEAEGWELEARAAYVLGKPIPRPVRGRVKNSKITTITDLVEHCRKVHWRSKKAGQSLTHNAVLFAEWVGPALPITEALTAEKVHEYVDYRQDEKCNSSATVNRHLSAIGVLVKYAVELELITKKVQMPWQEEGAGRLRFFSEEEEQALQAVLQLWGYPDIADLFAFLADTGFRLGEAEKLLWTDIRGRSITLEGAITKNSETRTVTATTRVQEVLARLKKFHGNRRGPFEWVNRQQLRAVWERLRAHFPWMGEDTVVHTFRHTCASRLVQRGVDLYRVKQWMGHKSLTTTLRYSHLAPKHLEELADVLEARPVQQNGGKSHDRSTRGSHRAGDLLDRELVGAEAG